MKLLEKKKKLNDQPFCPMNNSRLKLMNVIFLKFLTHFN